MPSRKGYLILELPWDGCQGEELKKLKAQVFELSKDSERLSLVEGLYEYEFHFKLEEYVFLATYMLHEDPNLKQARADLTAEEDISDEEFWRNYFYGIALIRKNAGLTSTLGQLVDTEVKRAKLQKDLSTNEEE